MSLMRPIQDDFSAGRIARRLMAKSDSIAHQTGLLECENMVPTPQGVLERRKGTRYVDQYNANVGRLAKMKTTDNLNTCAIFTDDGKVRVVADGEKLAEGETIVYDSTVEGGIKAGASNLDFNVRRSASDPWVQYGNGTFPFVRIWNLGDNSDPERGMGSWKLNIPGGLVNSDITVTFNIAQITGTGDNWQDNRPPVYIIGTTRGGNNIQGLTTLPGGVGLKTFTFNPGGNSTIYITLEVQSDDGVNFQAVDIDYLKAYNVTNNRPDVTTKVFDKASTDFYAAISQSDTAAIQVNPEMTTLIASISTGGVLYQFDFDPDFPGDFLYMTYSTTTFNPDGLTGQIVSMHISPEGTKIYLASTSSPLQLYQYEMTTAWDLSTANTTAVGSKTFSTTASGPIHISDDGTKLYRYHTANDIIYQYTMSTPWDITTATYDTVSYIVTNVTQGNDFQLNGDGTVLWVLDEQASFSVIETFDLSTAFDISTATHIDQVVMSSDSVHPLLSMHIDDTDGKIFCGADDAASDLIFYAWDWTLTENYITLDHYYDSQELQELQFDNHPQKNEIWVTQRNHQPAILKYNETTKSWSFVGAITNGDITNPPADWSTAPAWGNQPAADASFPGAIAFHQGRVWFGGTNDQPNGLYASRTTGTLYQDFTTPDVTTNATAIAVYIASQAEIKWLTSTTDLWVGTSRGIYVPTSSTSLLTATDIAVAVKSKIDCNRAVPIFVSSLPVIVSADGKTITDVVPAEDGEDFVSKELTFDHKDITDNVTVSYLSYSRCRDNMIIGTTRGNKAVICLYNKHINKVGWYDLNIADGIVDGIALEDQSSCTNYFLIKMPGVTNKLILVADQANDYIDAMYQIQNASATTQVYAPELANQTMAVIADGVVIDDVTIDNTGYGTLSVAATNVKLGYNFTSKVKTLPKNVKMNPLENIHAAFKSWHKIYVHILDSARPSVNGYQKPNDGPTGNPTLVTEKMQVIDSGWDEDAQIEIIQNQPYPLTVLAIHGLMSGDEI